MAVAPHTARRGRKPKPAQGSMKLRGRALAATRGSATGLANKALNRLPSHAAPATSATSAPTSLKPRMKNEPAGSSAPRPKMALVKSPAVTAVAGKQMSARARLGVLGQPSGGRVLGIAKGAPGRALGTMGPMGGSMTVSSGGALGGYGGLSPRPLAARKASR